MRKMWKRALAGVLTASMALSLAACGGSSSNGGSSADGSTTLEVWSSNLSDSQRENVKKLVAQYEEQTGVKVNYTEFSYDMLHDKILSAAAGGSMGRAEGHHRRHRKRLFGPHNNCTRAQIVTFLYRMYGSK